VVENDVETEKGYVCKKVEPPSTLEAKL